MSYQPVTIDQWGGLNVATDPIEVPLNQAVDGIAFDLDAKGRIRLQPEWTVIESASVPLGGPKVINGRIYSAHGVFDSDYSDTGWTAEPGANDFSGGGRDQDVYVAVPGGTLKKYDTDAGTLSASIADTPNCQKLAAMPVSGRLVAAGIGSEDPSLVKFSNAPTESAPTAVETWTFNDYIRLAPGDGEQVMALVPWDTYLFAFKQTKFFVIQGESLGASGTPIFNFRPVESGGIGCSVNFGAVAAPEGIYFLSKKGVYFTNGGSPVCISDAIAPLFDFDLPLNEWTRGRWDLDQGCIGYYNGRVYVSANNGSFADYMLVYDVEARAWMCWDVPASGRFASGPDVGLVFSYSDGDAAAGFEYGVAYIDFSLRTGNSILVTPSYVVGGTDLGTFDVKVVREAIMAGVGTHSFQLRADYVAGTNTGLTLGASTIGEARDRRAARGRYIGYKLSSFDMSGGYISRLTLNLRDVRASGDDG